MLIHFGAELQLQTILECLWIVFGNDCFTLKIDILDLVDIKAKFS